MYPHFGHIYSEMGKENKLSFRNYIIYLPKKNPKNMKQDENKTLHLIMMMVKNYTENYLQTIYKTLFTKIIYIKK